MVKKLNNDDLQDKSLMELIEELRITVNEMNKVYGLPELPQRIFQCDDCGTWTADIIHVNNDGSYCSNCKGGHR